MASAPSGLSAQLTLAEETVYGTAVATTRALDFIDESLKTTRVRLESKGLRAGRRVVTSSMWNVGERTVNGVIKTELDQIGNGLLWKHAMGALASAGPTDSAYTYTATPGDLTGKSLTIQVGRPDITGTVRPFTYSGCKIAKWTLSCKAGEIGKLDLDIVAQDENITTVGVYALVNAASMYPATMLPVSFVSGSLTVGGSGVDVKDITLTGDNKLDAKRLFLRAAATVKEPLETSWRDYMGTFTADFSDLTQYNTFVNASEVALVLTFQGGLIGSTSKYQTVITMNVRYDGETPVVPGPVQLAQAVPFKAVASTSVDSSAISIAYQTSEATP